MNYSPLPRFYCLEGASSYNNSLCPSGYVCPTGTRYSTEFACPRGHYNPASGSYNDTTDCLKCPPGKYCQGLISLVDYV